MAGDDAVAGVDADGAAGAAEAGEDIDPASPPGFTEEEPSKSPDSGATRTLMAILRLHTFIDLYKQTADIPKLPLRGKICFALEVLFHLFAAILLLAIVGAIAYKTLAPLPHI